VQIERISDFAIDSHAEIIAKVLRQRKSLDNLALTVLYLLKFAVRLDLCLDHPNVKVLHLGT
jgi:hypothetical protein